MTPEDQTAYPIAQLQTLLRDRAKLNLSPIELAEILWLAWQQSEGMTLEPDEAAADSKSEPDFEESVTTSENVVHQPELDQDTSGTESSRAPEADSDEQSEPSAAVVTEPPAVQQPDGPAETALPVNIPAAAALRNRREIGRSLRPLMRKVPSRIRQTIDEAATVLQIAENNTWSPVTQPEPERWLELAIVIEVTNLLEVWREPIAELQQLLVRHGAFRDVRIWQLQPDSHGQLQLFLKTAAGLQGSPRSPKELMDAGGRRLILLLSDCTSQAWRSGAIPQLLKLWARLNPVTIVQLLPERYWDRSALGRGYPVALRSRIPGALSRDRLWEGLSQRRQRGLLAGLKLPVITIHPQSIGQWAKAIAAASEQATTGIVLGAQSFVESLPVTESSAPLSAKQLVQRFRSTASDKAQELADMMAVLPINWSVIRLVQKNLVGQTEETGALQLAEIFLSGLLRPRAIAAQQTGQARQATEYDFVEGVRDVLLGAIPISEARAVGDSIAAQIVRQLPQAVQERINADIANRFGESLSYFEAFLIPDLDWGEEDAAEMLSFARVTGQVLRRWGGEYAELAQALEQNRKPSEETSGDEPQPEFPPLEVLEFMTGRLVDADEAVPFPPIETETFSITTIEIQDELETEADGLERFKFTVATICRERDEWLIERERGSASRFVERLGDEIGLQMVAIPGGRFLMGSPEDKLDRDDDEGPQHEVAIPPFFMGRYPVTQAQWQFVAENLPQVRRHLEPTPSEFPGEDRPVERVNWFEAVEFCQRLAQYTGREYSLPSEAEWEYACRAGTDTPFHFGYTLSPELANYRYDVSYDNGPTAKSLGETTPVGQYGVANAFGLSDMHGNVREWCADHWHQDYRGAPENEQPWLDSDANENARRVRRGGAWGSSPRYCRSACRYGSDPRGSYSNFGFRVVSVAPRALL